MTTVLPRRVVLPFPNRPARTSEAPRSSAPPASVPPAAPAEGDANDSGSAPVVSRITKKSAVVATPPAAEVAAPKPSAVVTQKTVAVTVAAAPPMGARTLRRARSLMTPRVVAAGLGALGMIFGLGIMVGHLASSRPAAAAVAAPVEATVAAPTVTQPAAAPEATPPAAPAAPAPVAVESSEVAKADDDGEHVKPQIVITLGPKHAARHAHVAKASHSAPSKRVATNHTPAPAAPPAAAPAKAPADAPSAAPEEDAIGAANAADELARAQLEAVMR